MLLLDLSSIVISEAIVIIEKEKVKMTQDVIRRIVVSQILRYKTKYKEYGDLVICADGRNYWRRDVFPLYKKNRHKDRKESSFNWELFYVLFDKIQKEITEELPWKLIKIERMEADDIIAVLAERYAQVGPVMIVSSDKDLIQLQQKSKNIKQFSPKTKKQLSIGSKKYSLVEHIIRGDSSDGIPNIFSDDDTFMCEDKRQKQIKAVFVNEAKKYDTPEQFLSDDVAIAKYKRNETLIDLDKIPSEYKVKTINAYEGHKKNIRAKILSYAIKHKLDSVFKQLGS